MPDIKNIADRADVIVNGYAFTSEDDGIHVLNLDSPDKAVVYDHYQEMYLHWSQYSNKGYYEK